MVGLGLVGWSLGDARFGGENVILAHGPRSKKPGSA
jgi:hypothetical protein